MVIDDHENITEKYIEEITNAIEEEKMAEAVSKFIELLEHTENARLDIAVVGESGSGTSSFVNAIRGLGDEDDGAAPTGVVEIRTRPTPYPHPNHSNVTVWDLPGIGTQNLDPIAYLEQINFFRYDFFILISSEHFKSNHAKLAREMRELGQLCYFVRSKVDTDLEAAKKRRPRACDEETVLEKIRHKCQRHLRKEGIRCPQVFLLSSWELSKYDFMALEETVEKELAKHKRHAFILALPNVSSEVLQKKKEAFRNRIWAWAMASCGMAASTTPGLSVACDVTILMKCLSKYHQSFGLDDDSLNRLAEKVSVPVEEIKEVINSPLAKEISSDLVSNLLTKVGGGASMVAEYIAYSQTLPMFGSLLAGGISFRTTYYMLQDSLNEVEEDAQRVILKAFEPQV